ncbi:MAG: bacteriohemerythrin [Bacteroidota bacterium]
MTIANWKPEYSVSVKSIDEDHQKLFDLLNQLFEAMTKGQGKSIVPNIINELENYSVYHFNREELFFRATNYPNSVKHIQEHQCFKQKIAELKNDVLGNKAMVAPDVLGFLSDWLKNHIAICDKAYEEHFKKYGVV